jgi:putative endonuclease
MKTSYQIGIDAENVAQNHLLDCGYEIIAIREKTKLGEVDLIARKDNIYIFCEVKARKNTYEAMFSISLRQQKRIINSASIFIAEHQLESCDIRFDVIIIDKNKVFEHIENAFIEN